MTNSYVFIDSSVLFSAVMSSTGSARDLIRLAIQGKVNLVASTYVLREVTENLSEKAPSVAPLLAQFLREIEWQMVEPSPEEVLAVAQYTALKDAPVVAAAVKAGCDYLVTYDHRHLLDVPEVAEKSGLTIVTPDVVVTEVQGNE